VDLNGDEQAVAAVVADVETNGLATQSFANLAIATTTTKAPTQAPTAAPTQAPTAKIVLDGDYDTVIGTDKEKFLRECTATVSSNGAREVGCVDVRPGSIVVDLNGDEQAVAAVVADVETNGLATQSFQKLAVAITTTKAVATKLRSSKSST